MIMETTEELLWDFAQIRNLKQQSITIYRSSIKLFTDFQEMSMIDLLNEAETEEEKGIRWKHRSLKKRLISFRTYLNQNYKKNYAKATLTRIITVYTTYEIEVHKLPPVSTKNYIEPTPLTFKDLLDKAIIKEAYHISDNLMKALILFMSSSGCALTETTNLTVGMFIDATTDYHHTNNVLQAISLLKDTGDVIPTFKIKRQKTNKYYYTFCSPEATHEILNYLMSNRIETDDDGNQKPIKLHPNDKLFDNHKITISRKFIEINNTLQLGIKGSFNRMRSHMLRKFHASALKNHGMDKYTVNSLQGKGLNSTDEAYFYDDPKVLKEKYIEHLSAVTILDDINVMDIKSPEFIELEKKLIKKETEIENMQDRLSIIEDKLSEIDNRPVSRTSILEKISKQY